MAKTKKKVKESVKSASDSTVVEVNHDAIVDKVVDTLEQRLFRIEARIDRIVAAIDKSKSVRNL